ncbi:MAG: cbb3-type cytochrome c oxidase subunit 3 [Rhodocyclaceae bacterium]|jgi:cytochrome c oxidase cbb3-type subunit 4|nr:cbb3-type cytochrome c oxidase subunit 3 [Rhodocyclaceae bacterium]
MDINDLRSLFTVLVIALFAGIVWWAYSAKRKEQFDEAAKSVFDDELPPPGKGAGSQHN